MRELGVFRFKRGDLEIELSQMAIARAMPTGMTTASTELTDEQRASRRKARARREEILEHAHVEGIPPDMDLEESEDLDA